MMNRKGFTLVEVLATLVILALILGVASFSVLSVIESSRDRSEKLFVEKLSKSIDDYLDLKGSSLFSVGTPKTFSKCLDQDCGEQNTYTVSAYSLQRNCKEGESGVLPMAMMRCNVTLSDLVEEGLVEKEDIVNPRNQKNCLEGKDPEILVYKDSDYVYYYYVDLSGENTSCEVDSENAIINTLPESLSLEVGLS